jgi:hypothetical protein
MNESIHEYSFVYMEIPTLSPRRIEQSTITTMISDKNMMNVSYRLLQGLQTAMLFIVPMYVMNTSWSTATPVLVLLFITGVIMADVEAIFLGLSFSLVAICVATLLFGQFDGGYKISGNTVLVAVMLCALLGSAGIKYLRQNVVKTNHALSLFLFILIFTKITENCRQWTSAEAFGILVGNGEDNAAWLVSLSKSVIKNETVLSAQSAASGGPSTGVFISFFRELFYRVDSTAFVSNGDNALVLLRMYTIIGVLIALLWMMVASSMLREQKQIVRAGFAVVSGLTGYSFIMGLATVGHFSAVVAVFFLSTAVLVHEVLQGTNIRFGLAIQRGTVFLSLISAGQAWFPLTAVALIYLALISVQVVLNRVPKKIDKKIGRQVATSAAAAFLISYFLYMRIFPSFLQNVFDLDFVIYNLTLPGGYATVNPWLVLLGFSVAIFWGFSPKVFDRTSQMSLVIALFIPIVGLFTWSYFLAPYTPQYGAWKYLYIGAAVAVPWALPIIGQYLQSKKPSISLLPIPMVLLLGLGLLSPPFNHVSWVEKAIPAGYEWVDTVVNELRENPGRPVVCSNSIKDDDGQKYIAYLCSRMALGLGGFDEFKHRVWGAANFCTVNAEQMKDEWPTSELRNLAVVLFDPMRTSSFAGCQSPSEDYPNGLLSFVDWSVVRKLSPSGEVVFPKTTKLGD